MRDSAFGPPAIPPDFWSRPDVRSALTRRDIGAVFRLLRQHTGISQTRIGTAVDMAQGRVSNIELGKQHVAGAAVFARVANGLNMPDHARVILNLAPQAAVSGSSRPAALTSHEGHRPDKTPSDVVAIAAGETSAESLSLAAESGPESLTWLWQDVTEIARAGNRPALDVFTTARRVGRHAAELAGRTRRPGVLSDLYVICGQATALMASSAFDLDRWDESDALAKSAASYASLAGHASLQAWTLGLGALLANWRREPDLALSYFQYGMRIAPRGEPRARLRYIASRSYALLGDGASVAGILASAQDDQDDADQHPDALSGETGGEFAFGRPRAEACATAAWLDLGRSREALDAAHSAMTALTSLPGPRRPVSQIHGVRIDLATAHLLSGDLSSAAETLSPLLCEPASLRNVSLVGRLTRTRATLCSSAWAGNKQARQLADDIGQWVTADQEPPRLGTRQG
jgi:transcriptional regulator with XRE-family HTH domain